MLPLLREVGVVGLNHLQILVTGQLGDRRDRDLSLQGVYYPGVAERIADDALQLRELDPQTPEAAAENAGYRG